MQYQKAVVDASYVVREMKCSFVRRHLRLKGGRSGCEQELWVTDAVRRLAQHSGRISQAHFRTLLPVQGNSVWLMAPKKSDLYSSLWASCDELRGGMDASQYKGYVLFMLFIKYVSDKYGDSDDFAPPVTIPNGASFKDMVALKGDSDIGNKINTQVIQPLIDANSRLARTDFPDFNDPNKLG